MFSTIITHKNLGETPLEALERFRGDKIQNDHENSAVWQTISMTYAGRLDPMAEGELLILIGDECKNKEKYLGLDKEYEVEVLLGVLTDTYDILGLVVDEVRSMDLEVEPLLSKYVGKFTQPYPAYSSKTFNGKQLHELARAGELPDEMPQKEVEIYSLSKSKVRPWTKITAGELQKRIFSCIDMVKGDFRQDEIKAKWKDVLLDQNQTFPVISIKVKCSSGTYMRSLAHKIGQDSGFGAIALSINRTKIFS